MGLMVLCGFRWRSDLDHISLETTSDLPPALCVRMNFTNPILLDTVHSGALDIFWVSFCPWAPFSKVGILVKVVHIFMLLDRNLLHDWSWFWTAWARKQRVLVYSCRQTVKCSSMLCEWLHLSCRRAASASPVVVALGDSSFFLIHHCSHPWVLEDSLSQSKKPAVTEIARCGQLRALWF